MVYQVYENDSEGNNTHFYIFAARKVYGIPPDHFI